MLKEIWSTVFSSTTSKPEIKSVPYTIYSVSTKNLDKNLFFVDEGAGRKIGTSVYTTQPIPKTNIKVIKRDVLRFKVYP